MRHLHLHASAGVASSGFALLAMTGFIIEP
jgi:hypothetical protein